MKSIPKEYRQLIDPYIKSGELTVVQGSRHTSVKSSTGHKQPIPCSPSEHRAYANFKSQLKKFLIKSNISIVN